MLWKGCVFKSYQIFNFVMFCVKKLTTNIIHSFVRSLIFFMLQKSLLMLLKSYEFDVNKCMHFYFTFTPLLCFKLIWTYINMLAKSCLLPFFQVFQLMLKYFVKIASIVWKKRNKSAIATCLYKCKHKKTCSKIE